MSDKKYIQQLNAQKQKKLSHVGNKISRHITSFFTEQMDMVKPNKPKQSCI
jgi:hypothetical protein